LGTNGHLFEQTRKYGIALTPWLSAREFLLSLIVDQGKMVYDVGNRVIAR